MNQPFQGPNTIPEQNVNTRKRPLATSSVASTLSDLSDINKYIMTTEESTSRVLPSTLSKKKKQPEQQQDMDELEYMDLPAPSRATSQRNVPAFLHKLYNMVDDPSTDHLVKWSKGGNSFLVIGHEEFAKTILPRFYKHNTFSSFVRQLNMYDFHKIPNIQQTVMPPGGSEIWEFSSPHFQKGRPELLVFVTRKRIRNNNKQDGAKEATDLDKVNLAALVRDISTIKHHQSTITKDLAALHRDNEIIWQETLMAREKHEMHQQVLSKILQFLAAVFSNDVNALTDMSNEDVIQAQHISQGHEQVMLRNSTRHPFPAPSDSGISSDNSSNGGYLASDSSNDVSQVDSATNSNSSSGSEDDTRQKGPSKNSPPFQREVSTSSYSSPAPSISNMTPNMQRARSLQPTVDVHKLHKRHSSPFDPSINNNNNNNSNTTRRGPAVAPPGINSIQPSMHMDKGRSAKDITSDIDQLQVNVESLANQLGIDPAQYSDRIFSDFDGFSSNYSSMISTASRMDKLRLFELAGESPQPQEYLLGAPYAFMQNAPPFGFESVPNLIDTNYQSASSYFRELVKTGENNTKPPEALGFQSSLHSQNQMFDTSTTTTPTSNMIPDRSYVFQPPPKQ